MDRITDISKPTAKRTRFVLTRQNQKGQVSIFVALIFQVIFVFFALLINVGLLVHHKINLQQSVDLAAYYGAMKQAEILNAMAHVNFQIKQGFKLLTWRYRILGTFGIWKGDAPSGGFQEYPYTTNGTTFVYRGKLQSTGCPQTGGYGIQDVPFFCVAHPGFSSYKNQSENLCRVDCATYQNARLISKIASAGIQVLWNGTDGGASKAVDDAITQVNANLKEQCEKFGPINANYFARFMAAYIFDTNARVHTMELLAKNLSLSADEVVDIDGKKIKDASLLTLRNNLTEANLTGLGNLEVKAGYDDSVCKFQDGRTGDREFIKKIDFKMLNYFIHNCIPDTSTTSSAGYKYKPENVYDVNRPPDYLAPAFDSLPASFKAALNAVVVNDSMRHTVGYEKNPHCVEYYAVKATAEPMIPFLPLSKVKLVAAAVAKPFGGSMGPWYGKSWPFGAKKSDDNNNQSTQMDENLPLRDPGGLSPTIGDSIKMQPNFSLFVGDKEGLRDEDYIAAYHAALSRRQIGSNTTQNPLGVHASGPPAMATAKWPNNENWDEINLPASDMRKYDPVAKPSSGGMREIEVSAVAPNQFDVTFYSIDPDFYDNYYKRLYKGGISGMKNATGYNAMSPNDLRPDFGAHDVDDSVAVPAPLDPKSFSVRDQILMKNKLFNTATIPGGPRYSYAMAALINLQSSLLTGWTFSNFLDYSIFPEGPVNQTDRTMAFGQCLDKWNPTDASQMYSPAAFGTPMNDDSEYPPVPGNCNTGGRVGYSVKIVAPNMVTDKGTIENPLDPNFFNF